MARVATVFLRDHVDEDVLLEVARVMSCSPLHRPAGFVEGWDVEIEDWDLEPFLDWDHRRGHGQGFFRQDEHECRSRRIDLRGPTDLDPGPLPMEEAPEDITARHLILSR